MSSHIKDQQQTQKKDTQREFDADHLFNQNLMKTLAYTGIGFGFGMLSSLFFKHRAGMTMFFAGTGAGYGASNFINDLDHYKKFKSYNKDFQQQQPQTFQRQGQIESQDWQKYMPKEQSQFNQKNYQRGGSDDDNDSETKSREDDRDLTYSQKLAEEGAKKDEVKGAKPKGRFEDNKKTSGNEERSQKSSETKKQDINRQESSSKKQQESRKEQPKDQSSQQKQQESKKEQSKDQGHQQKQEIKKDLSKSDNKQQQQKQQESKKEQPKDQKQSEKQGQDNKKDINKNSSVKEYEKSSQRSGEDKQERSKRPSSSKDSEKSAPESFSTNQVDDHTFLSVEGQQFMDFRSNPYDAGKPKPGEDPLYRGSQRSTKGSNKDQAKGPDSHRAEQDRWGSSRETGNKMKLEHPDKSKAGSQFAGDNITSGSQTNAVIE